MAKFIITIEDVTQSDGSEGVALNGEVISEDGEATMAGFVAVTAMDVLKATLEEMGTVQQVTENEDEEGE